MAVQAAETYGYEIDPELRKDLHNLCDNAQRCCFFGAYTPEMRLARKTRVVTGLPDTYGRGRIVGDYRRVTLYGIDRRIEQNSLRMRKYVQTRYAIRMREEMSHSSKLSTR